MVGLQRGLPAVVKTPSGSVTRRQGRAGLRREARPRPGAAPHHLHHPLARGRDRGTPGMRWTVWGGRPAVRSPTDAPPCTTRSGRRDDRLVFGRGGGRLGLRRPHHPGALPRRPGDREYRRRHARHAAGRRATSRSSGGGAGPWSAPSTASPGWAVSASTATSSTASGYSGNGVSASNLIGRTLALCSAGPRGRLRPVAAGLRSARVPAAGAHPLRRRPRRAQRHRALRDRGGRREEARPGVAGPQARVSTSRCRRARRCGVGRRRTDRPPANAAATRKRGR